MREQARSAKDFARADELRGELSAMSVALNDKTSQWRTAEGITGRIPTFSEVEQMGGADAYAFEQMGGQPGGMDTSVIEIQNNIAQLSASDSEEVKAIKSLVQQREQARAAKDFARSDSIRDELRGLGAEVYDKEKMWRHQAIGTSGVIIGYLGDGEPTNLEVETLVVQRERARHGKDYAEADMIRNELKARGVEIYDKDKVWKTTSGRSGGIPDWNIFDGNGGPPMAPPTVSHNAYGAVEMTPQAILRAAIAAQAVNPAATAQILHSLQAIAHAPPMPLGRGRVPIPAPPAPAPPAPRGGGHAGTSADVGHALLMARQIQAANRGISDGEIENLVGTREKLRQSRDFAGGDAVRECLRGLGVEMHEKDKRWSTTDGRHGAIPSWSDLAY